MIIIYSRASDNFVNKVIDCLDEKFARICDRDPILIKEISLEKGKMNFIIQNTFSDSINTDWGSLHYKQLIFKLCEKRGS